MEENKIWIILAVVLGSLMLALAAVLFLFCRRRAKKKVRGFSLRAVTPLDDAEFESWRRPSQYAQRPEKYGIRPVQPAPIRTTEPPPMFEKDIRYQSPRTPSPQDDDYVSPITSPTSSVRKPERVRRKSSVCSSVADRPPTPYSPTSTTSEFPRSSYASRKSYGSPRIHYPSMSEASAFNFNFSSDVDSQAHDLARRSDDRPLNLSYQHGWHSDKV